MLTRPKFLQKLTYGTVAETVTSTSGPRELESPVDHCTGIPSRGRAPSIARSRRTRQCIPHVTESGQPRYYCWRSDIIGRNLYFVLDQ